MFLVFFLAITMFTYLGQCLVFLTPSQALAQIIASGAGFPAANVVDAASCMSLLKTVLASLGRLTASLCPGAAMNSLWGIFNGFMLPYPSVRAPSCHSLCMYFAPIEPPRHSAND